MLIGYPVDNRNKEDISNCIKPFGRLICWQKDEVLARIYVKARVTDLVDIPHYLILSEGDGHEGVSLTVQCEIVQQHMMGVSCKMRTSPLGDLMMTSLSSQVLRGMSKISNSMLSTFLQFSNRIWGTSKFSRLTMWVIQLFTTSTQTP
jgi:hypothetical protein